MSVPALSNKNICIYDYALQNPKGFVEECARLPAQVRLRVLEEGVADPERAFAAYLHFLQNQDVLTDAIEEERRLPVALIHRQGDYDKQVKDIDTRLYGLLDGMTSEKIDQAVKVFQAAEKMAERGRGELGTVDACLAQVWDAIFGGKPVSAAFNSAYVIDSCETADDVMMCWVPVIEQRIDRQPTPLKPRPGRLQEDVMQNVQYVEKAFLAALQVLANASK